MYYGLFLILMASDGLYYTYKFHIQQFTVLNNNLCILDAGSCCHCRIEHLVLSFFKLILKGATLTRTLGALNAVYLNLTDALTHSATMACITGLLLLCCWNLFYGGKKYIKNYARDVWGKIVLMGTINATFLIRFLYKINLIIKLTCCVIQIFSTNLSSIKHACYSTIMVLP